MYSFYRPLLFFIAMLLIACGATTSNDTSAGAHNDTEVKADTQFVINDSLTISLNDGTVLSATMVRNRNDSGRLPVILMFSIYPGEHNISNAIQCASHHYIGIVAYTRGKRIEGHDIAPFEHDAADVYNVIDWISGQIWCNGKIGMYGGSYLGFTQWAAAKRLHPALKTIVPQVAVAPGIEYPYSFGINTCYSLRWLHYVTNSKITDTADFNDAIKWDSIQAKWYASGRAFNTLDSIEGHPNNVFHRWLQHPYHDAYWKSMTPTVSEFAKFDIPAFTITGYWDVDQLGALYYFDQHAAYSKDNKDVFLIGPYDHFGAQGHPLSEIDGYTIDPVARINIDDLVFHWFDHIMKDSARPVLLENKINFQVMGANKWRHVSSFQQMNNDTLTFYFNSRQIANRYRLLPVPCNSTETIHQEVDLADRSDSNDNVYHSVLADTLIHEDEMGRNAMLTFISDQLKEPVTINGSFIAHLETVINKKDVDLFMTLYEQMPDGRYFSLSSTLARVSLIGDPGKRKLLKPGKAEQITLSNTSFTSRQLSIGSRIVIVLGVVKNCSMEVNYGTGKDVSTETIKDAGAPVTIQWLASKCCIKLPIMKPAVGAMILSKKP